MEKETEQAIQNLVSFLFGDIDKIPVHEEIVWKEKGIISEEGRVLLEEETYAILKQFWDSKAKLMEQMKESKEMQLLAMAFENVIAVKEEKDEN